MNKAKTVTKKRIPFLSALLAIALTSLAIPANATINWPTDGKFVLGNEALWQFDDYCIAAGSDAAEHFLTTYSPPSDPNSTYNHGIYYPMEYMLKLNGQNEYLLCEDQANSVVTNEANGDITIEIPRFELDEPNVWAQVVYRIYATPNNGWLLRMETIFTNESGADYEITDLFSYQYAQNYTYDSGSSSTFMTSTSNAATSLASNDTWLMSAINGGQSIVQTVAWARDGQAGNYGINSTGQASVDAGLRNYYANRTLTPNESLHFIQFTNMNIPVPNYTSSTAEIAAAQTQVAEFASFSGRLVAGLDENIDYIGWGFPQRVDPAEDKVVVEPTLAATGAGANNLWMSVGAVSLVIAGGIAVTLRLRRSSRK